SSSTTEGAHAIKATVVDDAGNSRDLTAWTIYLDKFSPTFGTPTGTLAKPTAWVTDPNPSLTVNVSDTGSGVAKDTIQFDAPNGASNVKTNKKSDGTTDCDATSGCAASLSHSWSPTLVDGVHQVNVTAQDAVGRTVSDSWSVKLDRTRPTAGTPTGSLSAPGKWIQDGAKALHVDASDASSGVRRVELRVDNTLVDTKSATCSPSCGTSFGADLSWTPS